jgi:hypothetical protein
LDFLLTFPDALVEDFGLAAFVLLVCDAEVPEEDVELSAVCRAFP